MNKPKFINHANLFSGTRDLVVYLIDKYVKDPALPSSQKRKFIYSREPDYNKSFFSGFPYMIVRETGIDYGEEETADNSMKTVNASIIIEVVSSDRDFNNRDGNGEKYLDMISDQVHDAIMSEESRILMRQKGLGKPMLTSEPVTPESLSNTLVYRRVFLLEFSRKKKMFQ